MRCTICKPFPYNPCPPNIPNQNYFSGFSCAIQAINSGTSPATEIIYTVFEDNLTGISINGINYHKVLLDEFPLYHPNAVGLSVNHATGYKIEENSFMKILPDPAPYATTGLSVSNSGAAENEVYKNIFENLYIAQGFSGRTGQLIRKHYPRTKSHKRRIVNCQLSIVN